MLNLWTGQSSIGSGVKCNMAGRILLVEADVVLGAVLGEVLRRNGYAVMFETSLKNAAAHIHSASAVILDVDTLSAEKELALLDLIRPYGDSLPVVLMGLQECGALHERLHRHIHRQQNNHLTCVQKPFRNEELVAAVRRVHKSV